MDFINIAKTEDIPAGEMRLFTAGGHQILITNIGGKFYAIGGKCTHAGGDLSKGVLEGTIVKCPRHGSRFDVTSGKNISGPKIGFLKIKVKDEQVFELKIEENNISISIG